MKPYNETIDWLFNQFPAYQQIGQKAYKPTLNNTIKLLRLLKNPEKNLKFIHVAGTNGKGSTCHLLASILQEHELKVGLFTSPHLLDFRERIKVNGKEVDKQFVIEFTTKIRTLNVDFSPSFFEITFAMALVYFAQSNCEICVIETGLGGRLDATNVITPILSIITNIGLDHQQFLGNTKKEIANEKAGIIKKNVPVLITEKNTETQAIFELKAKETNSPLHWVDFTKELQTSLKGKYQEKNTATAYNAAQIIQKQLNLSEEKILSGILNIQTNCPIRGRMEIIQATPKVIIDAAHNKEGIMELLVSIQAYHFKQLHIIYGASSDKEIERIITLFPKNASLYFTEFKNKRSYDSVLLKSKTRALQQTKQYFISPLKAYKKAVYSAKKDDLILIFGSFFLIEEFL